METNGMYEDIQCSLKRISNIVTEIEDDFCKDNHKVTLNMTNKLSLVHDIICYVKNDDATSAICEIKEDCSVIDKINNVISLGVNSIPKYKSLSAHDAVAASINLPIKHITNGDISVDTCSSDSKWSGSTMGSPHSDVLELPNSFRDDSSTPMDSRVGIMPDDVSGSSLQNSPDKERDIRVSKVDLFSHQVASNTPQGQAVLISDRPKQNMNLSGISTSLLNTTSQDYGRSIGEKLNKNVIETRKHDNFDLPKRRTPDGMEKVVVLRAIDPSEIYVQKCSDLNQLRKMEVALNDFCNKGLAISIPSYDGGPPDTNMLIKVPKRFGTLCLAPHGDKKWARGMFGEASANAIGEFPDISNNVLAPVHLIDYGIIAWEPLRRLRQLPDQFFVYDRFCFRCSLININPDMENQSGPYFSHESKAAITEICNNKMIYMSTYFKDEQPNDINDLLYVNLFIPQDDTGGISEPPFSLRDYLIFMELARPDNNSVRRPIQKNESTFGRSARKFFKRPALKLKEVLHGRICHYDDLSLLVFQLVSELPRIAMLANEIHSEYKAVGNPAWRIHCPCVGMPCMALYTNDGKWYRARITRLLPERNVNVLFVDYGNEMLLNVTEIQKIPDRFLKDHIFAIRCSFYGVQPLEGNSFSQNAVDYFLDLTSDTVKLDFTIMKTVLDCKEDEVFPVCVFRDKMNKYICLNSVLVLEGLAAPKVGEILPGATVLGTAECSPDQDSSVVVRTSNGPRTINLMLPCLAVSVVSVISPWEFYVQNAKTYDTGFLEMLQHLTRLFKDARKPILQTTWKRGDICCAHFPHHNEWCRAQVINVHDTDLVDVFYFDYGNVYSISQFDIRMLPDKFRSIPPYAVRCHLSGVVPPGGSGRWPDSVCEFVDNLASKNWSYIKILDNNEVSDRGLDSLSVEWLYENPSSIVCDNQGSGLIDVSKELIIQGKGLPNKTNTQPSVRYQGMRLVTAESVARLRGSEKTYNINSLENASKLLSDCPSSNVIPKSANSPLPKSNMLNNDSESNMPSRSSLEKDLGQLNLRASYGISDESPHVRRQYLPCVVPDSGILKMGITHIDKSTGFVYGHLLAHDTVLYAINKNLQEEIKRDYTNGVFGTSEFSVGDPCTAKYTDNVWYRSTVIAVKAETMTVFFVDFGNCEEVSIDNVNKFAMLEPPVQSFAMKICDVDYNISTWSADEYNKVNQLVTEQFPCVDVNIVDRSVEPYIANIYFPSAGISLSDVLLQLGLAIAQPSKGLCRFSDPGHLHLTLEWAALVQAFRPVEVPPIGTLFRINISTVPLPDAVYIQFIAEHSTAIEVAKTMEDDPMQFPGLEDPQVGLPCLAKSCNNRQWGRAVITHIDMDVTKVIFVDFGWSEEQRPHNLRSIPQQYIKRRVSARLAFISELKPIVNRSTGKLIHGTSWSEEALRLFKNIMSKNSECNVRINEMIDGIPHISMIPVNETDPTVLYKRLMDKGFATYKEQ